MLHCSAYANGNVEPGRNRTAGLPDLFLMGPPAGIDNSPGSSDGATEGLRQIFDQRELGRVLESTPATDYDLGRVEAGHAAALGRRLDDGHPDVALGQLDREVDDLRRRQAKFGPGKASSMDGSHNGLVAVEMDPRD